jgi:DNA mismatch repair ATPase MutS
MNVKEKDGKMVYTYTLKKGISKVQGAVSILEDMNYPEEIVRSVKSSKHGEDDDICNE